MAMGGDRQVGRPSASRGRASGDWWLAANGGRWIAGTAESEK